jgi:hypothetical protein
MQRKSAPTTKRAVLTVFAVAIAALMVSPTAFAEDPCLPENGCVPGVVGLPVPIDQAGDPQPVTIEWVPMADAPPYIEVPLGLPAPPKGKCAKHKAHSRASAAKRCKRKRH